MVHAKQYLRVNDKLQKVPQGTQIALTEKQAEGLGDRVKKIGQENKTVDLTTGSKKPAEGTKPAETTGKAK